MSMVKDLIQSVAKEGNITHDFSIGSLKFVIGPIKTEEQFLADGQILTNKIKEKYGATDLMTLPDTVQKYRTVAMVALSTITVNGQSPIDENETIQNQFKQRQELIDELLGMPPEAIDKMSREYYKLSNKQKDFYTSFNDNVEKS